MSYDQPPLTFDLSDGREIGNPIMLLMSFEG